MDILDIIINFINVTDSENLVKKNWDILSDKNEYLGERIISLFAFTLLIICYIALIFGIIFLIYKLFLKI
jgi:hypothetical protein